MCEHVLVSSELLPQVSEMINLCREMIRLLSGRVLAQMHLISSIKRGSVAEREGGCG